MKEGKILFESILELAVVLLVIVLWIVLMFPIYEFLSGKTTWVGLLGILGLCFLGAVIAILCGLGFSNFIDWLKRKKEHLRIPTESFLGSPLRRYEHCGYRATEWEEDNVKRVTVGVHLSTGWKDKETELTFAEACNSIDEEIDFNLD